MIPSSLMKLILSFISGGPCMAGEQPTRLLLGYLAAPAPALPPPPPPGNPPLTHPGIFSWFYGTTFANKHIITPFWQSCTHSPRDASPTPPPCSSSSLPLLFSSTYLYSTASCRGKNIIGNLNSWLKIARCKTKLKSGSHWHLGVPRWLRLFSPLYPFSSSPLSLL